MAVKVVRSEICFARKVTQDSRRDHRAVESDLSKRGSYRVQAQPAEMYGRIRGATTALWNPVYQSATAIACRLSLLFFPGMQRID